MKITPLPSALLLVGHAAATELTDAEYEQLREEALARPRRIFADNDGCDVTAYPAGKPIFNSTQYTTTFPDCLCDICHGRS